MQRAGYDLGSRFARGKIIAAAVTSLFCFDHRQHGDSMEAERAELIAINLNVAATMHHIFRYINNIRSIDERSEHELETNRKTTKGVANDCGNGERDHFC